MAAKLSGGGGGKYQVEQNSEINVTPFVDIMLVLLNLILAAAAAGKFGGHRAYAPLSRLREMALVSSAAKPSERVPYAEMRVLK